MLRKFRVRALRLYLFAQTARLCEGELVRRIEQPPKLLQCAFSNHAFASLRDAGQAGGLWTWQFQLRLAHGLSRYQGCDQLIDAQRTRLRGFQHIKLVAATGSAVD